MMRNKWMMSLCCGAAMLVCVPVAAQQNVQPEPMQTGKYQPTWESLAAYECPDWFRDAKFGIWAQLGTAVRTGVGRLVRSPHVLSGTLAARRAREEIR